MIAGVDMCKKVPQYLDYTAIRYYISFAIVLSPVFARVLHYVYTYML